MNEPCLEMSFALVGHSVPANNGYFFYSPICTLLDSRLPPGVGIRSVGGLCLQGVVYLNRDSTLRIRTDSGSIPLLAGLAGQELSVNGHKVCLGSFSIKAVPPAASLYSRQVVYNDALDADTFLARARDGLDRLGIEGATPFVPFNTFGACPGTLQRRVISIRGKNIVGFALQVDHLSARDSATLLCAGLGGKRHMGCGIFSPTRTA